MLHPHWCGRLLIGGRRRKIKEESLEKEGGNLR